MQVAVLISGGKDSLYATWCAMHQYEVIAVIGVTVKESLVYHVQKTEILRAVSECLGIPLILKVVSHQDDEEKAIEAAIKESEAEAIITGGLLSDFQRYHFNKVASRCGIPCFSPLWRKTGELLMQELLNHRLVVIFTSVSAMGLTRDLIGRQLDEDILKSLIEMSKQTGLNITGEGGEYETLVLDAPFYKKRISIEQASVVWNETAGQGEYVIESVKIVSKVPETRE
ncbi:MAG: diphthine--ammonia ligase [Candidatus Odinarchaeota archaeon]